MTELFQGGLGWFTMHKGSRTNRVLEPLCFRSGYLSNISSSSWVIREQESLQRRSNIRRSRPLRLSTPSRLWVIARIHAFRESRSLGSFRGSRRRSVEFLLSAFFRLQLFRDRRSTPSQIGVAVLIRAFMV